MSLPVTLSESALQDLQNIQQYYLNQGSTKIAEQLLEKIFAKLELLADYPEMGRIVPEFNINTLRELIHSPYRIVYRYESQHIKVIRIWRGERLLHLS
jgi:toxin ParE1/3/4